MRRLIVIVTFLLAVSISKADNVFHNEVQDNITKISNEIGVDPHLMAAICYKESRFKYFHNFNDGGSPSHGPCQIKSITAKHVGLYKDYMTSEDTIRVGATYFKENLKRCGSIRSAIAAYNTGRCIKSPKRGGYVDSVLSYYKMLRNGKSLYKQ